MFKCLPELAQMGGCCCYITKSKYPCACSSPCACTQVSGHCVWPPTDSEQGPQVLLMATGLHRQVVPLCVYTCPKQDNKTTGQIPHVTRDVSIVCTRPTNKIEDITAIQQPGCSVPLLVFQLLHPKSRTVTPALKSVIACIILNIALHRPVLQTMSIEFIT